VRPTMPDLHDQLEPDWHDPAIQQMAESQAIFEWLANLKLEFTQVDGELTDPQWTAFRALAKVGAVEGIMRQTVQEPGKSPEVSFHHAGGDYVAAVSSDPLPKGTAVTFELVKARLTGKGHRWAQSFMQILPHEPVKARAFILALIWRTAPEPGGFTRVPDTTDGCAGAAVADQSARTRYAIEPATISTAVPQTNDGARAQGVTSPRTPMAAPTVNVVIDTEKIAAAIEKLSTSLAARADDGGAKDSAGWTAARGDATVAGYLKGRKAKYMELLPRCLAGEKDALREFAEVFGPKAIADTTGNGLSRGVVAKTPTYTRLLQPVLNGKQPQGLDLPVGQDGPINDILANMRRQAGGK
jgi:hypothetical protein